MVGDPAGGSDIVLRGISWDHPRATRPLQATLAEYASIAPGVRVEWHTRSLLGFADDDLEALASRFDLLLIDHPFVGDAAAGGAFLPLDELLPADVLAERAERSVGPSHASYTLDGRQWALAIDAAALVSVMHPACGAEPMPRTWDQVLTLAGRLHREGRRFAVPLVPTDLVPSFYAIANAHHVPLFASLDRVAAVEDARPVLDLMARLRDLSHPDALGWNPPTLLDRMLEGMVHYSPMLFGYSNYARATLGAGALRFGDLPTVSGDARGSCLGGAGIAVSASSAAPGIAAAYAAWLTSAEVQAGEYVRAGGQPGRIEAWTDPDTDRACGGFFSGTLATLQGAWVRPRVAGYQAFQIDACRVLRVFIEGLETADGTMDRLNDLWRDLRTGAAR